MVSVNAIFHNCYIFLPRQKKNIMIMTKKRRKILRLYIFSLRLSALAWGNAVRGCQLMAKG